MPSFASPFQPRSSIQTCSSWSYSSSLMTFLTFFKNMTRAVSDIWKKEIRQAGPIPPRAGKQPCVVAQGSADFMGPRRPCGPRPADSKLISCSGHSWRQSQVEGCRREVRRHGNDKKIGEEGYREISEVLYKLPGPQVPTRDQVLQNDNKKKKKKGKRRKGRVTKKSL